MSKPYGRFFQIMCAFQKVRTLPSISGVTLDPLGLFSKFHKEFRPFLQWSLAKPNTSQSDLHKRQTTKIHYRLRWALVRKIVCKSRSLLPMHCNALPKGSYVSFFYEEKEGDQFSLWPKFFQRNYFF